MKKPTSDIHTLMCVLERKKITNEHHNNLRVCGKVSYFITFTFTAYTTKLHCADWPVKGAFF